MKETKNNAQTDSAELSKLNTLRKLRAELDQKYKDLYSESERIVEQIEYREITDPEVIEELSDILLELGDDDFSFHELFRRLSLYLNCNREDLDERMRTGYGTLYKPPYRLNDNRDVKVQFVFFNRAFAFIRTGQQNARESVEKQREAIREYCAENEIPIHAEQAFIGPAKYSGVLMDYAFTEMVRSMCNSIVAADITRFGRDAREVESIIRAFREKGITVYSAKEGNITNFSIPFDPEEFVRLKRKATETSGNKEDIEDPEDVRLYDAPDNPVLNM